MGVKERNVLCVGNFSSDTGYAWKLIEHLWTIVADKTSELGYGTIACYPRVAGLNSELEKSDIKIIEHQFQTATLMNCLSTTKLIKSNGIKIIYLTDRPYLSICYSIYRAVGVKKIIVHDHTPGYRKPSSLGKRLLKTLMNKVPYITADAAIGVSPYVCKRLTEVNGIPTKKIHLVTNGIKDSPQIKDTYASNKIKIVTVARANYYKGIDFAIKVVAELERLYGTEVEYHLIGDGPDIEAFKALSKKLNLRDKVHFLGASDDVENILPAFDVAFHPSKGEAMCLAIVEYMRAGLPILVSSNLSVNSILEENHDALFYSENIIESAAISLNKLSEDEKLRERLGKNARSSFSSKYLRADMQVALNSVLKKQLT